MLAVADNPRPRFIAERCHHYGPRSWVFGVVWGLKPVQLFWRRSYRHALLIHFTLPRFVGIRGGLRLERY